MPWPGNVRELRNAVARRIALGELDRSADRPQTTAGAGELPDRRSAEEQPGSDIASVLAMNLPYPKARRALLDSFVRRYVARALAASGGSVAAAAAASGIARRYFQILRERGERADNDG
jgi:DNA-binding NtrC family response regulator